MRQAVLLVPVCLLFAEMAAAAPAVKAGAARLGSLGANMVSYPADRAEESS
jgi:hypothetical protein